MWANSTLRWLLILMLLCLFVALVFSSCFPAECPTTKPIAVVPSFSETVEKVMPGVVYIFVEVEAGQPGQCSLCPGRPNVCKRDI